MKYFQMLNEVGLVLGDKAYPKFGNVLIMAGGAGSGKGTILNNLILFDGKIMDVDQLKTTILNTRKAQDNFDKSKDFNKYDVSQPGSSKNRLLSVLQNSQNYERKFQEYMNSDIPEDMHELKQIFKGLTIADIDMKNADHTSLLHKFINDYLKLDELKKNAFFKSRNQDRLPNVIFDVTLKKLEDLTSIYNYCEQAGYDHSNIHRNYSEPTVKSY